MSSSVCASSSSSSLEGPAGLSKRPSVSHPSSSLSSLPSLSSPLSAAPAVGGEGNALLRLKGPCRRVVVMGSAFLVTLLILTCASSVGADGPSRMPLRMLALMVVDADDRPPTSSRTAFAGRWAAFDALFDGGQALDIGDGHDDDGGTAADPVGAVVGGGGAYADGNRVGEYVLRLPITSPADVEVYPTPHYAATSPQPSSPNHHHLPPLFIDYVTVRVARNEPTFFWGNGTAMATDVERAEVIRWANLAPRDRPVVVLPSHQQHVKEGEEGGDGSAAASPLSPPILTAVSPPPPPPAIPTIQLAPSYATHRFVRVRDVEGCPQSLPHGTNAAPTWTNMAVMDALVGYTRDFVAYYEAGRPASSSAEGLGSSDGGGGAASAGCGSQHHHHSSSQRIPRMLGAVDLFGDGVLWFDVDLVRPRPIPREVRLVARPPAASSSPSGAKTQKNKANKPSVLMTDSVDAEVRGEFGAVRSGRWFEEQHVPLRDFRPSRTSAEQLANGNAATCLGGAIDTSAVDPRIDGALADYCMLSILEGLFQRQLRYQLAARLRLALGNCSAVEAVGEGLSATTATATSTPTGTGRCLVGTAGGLPVRHEGRAHRNGFALGGGAGRGNKQRVMRFDDGGAKRVVAESFTAAGGRQFPPSSFYPQHRNSRLNQLKTRLSLSQRAIAKCVVTLPPSPNASSSNSSTSIASANDSASLGSRCIVDTLCVRRTSGAVLADTNPIYIAHWRVMASRRSQIEGELLAHGVGFPANHRQGGGGDINGDGGTTMVGGDHDAESLADAGGFIHFYDDVYLPVEVTRCFHSALRPDAAALMRGIPPQRGGEGGMGSRQQRATTIEESYSVRLSAATSALNRTKGISLAELSLTLKNAYGWYEYARRALALEALARRGEEEEEKYAKEAATGPDANGPLVSASGGGIINSGGASDAAHLIDLSSPRGPRALADFLSRLYHGDAEGGGGRSSSPSSPSSSSVVGRTMSYSVMLEDDAALRVGFPKRLKGLVQQMRSSIGGSPRKGKGREEEREGSSALPPSSQASLPSPSSSLPSPLPTSARWDVISLGTNLGHVTLMSGTASIRRRTVVPHVARSAFVLGTAGYVVSLQGALKLLRSLPTVLPVDVHLQVVSEHYHHATATARGASGGGAILAAADAAAPPLPPTSDELFSSSLKKTAPSLPTSSPTSSSSSFDLSLFSPSSGGPLPSSPLQPILSQRQQAFAIFGVMPPLVLEAVRGGGNTGGGGVECLSQAGGYRAQCVKREWAAAFDEGISLPPPPIMANKDTAASATAMNAEESTTAMHPNHNRVPAPPLLSLPPPSSSSASLLSSSSRHWSRALDDAWDSEERFFGTFITLPTKMFGGENYPL